MATRPRRPAARKKTPARKAPTRTTRVARALTSAAARPVKLKPVVTLKPAVAKAVAPAAKAATAKKPKLVRDSFTIPKNEYAVIELLKQRAARLGRPAKKSELLRAGVKALEAMTDAAFLGCISSVPSIKTGRPAKG